jgi:Cu(I)/Ag(I) efflux system protein CusF
VKTSFARTLTALALGLGVALSVAAQTVDGEVKKIDVDAGKITLKHGEIKNLDMPAMQMSFRVANPAWLKTLQVGDKVKFSADKVGGQFTVTALEVSK